MFQSDILPAKQKCDWLIALWLRGELFSRCCSFQTRLFNNTIQTVKHEVQVVACAWAQQCYFTALKMPMHTLTDDLDTINFAMIKPDALRSACLATDLLFERCRSLVIVCRTIILACCSTPPPVAPQGLR